MSEDDFEVPGDLGERGRRFIEAVLAAFIVYDDERELLVEIGRQLDLLERLAAADDPKAVRLLLSARSELRHLLSALRLPHPEAEPLRSGHSARASAAARARWKPEVVR